MLDGQPLEANTDSLGVALARAAEAAEARGRFVVEVVADGTLLDQAALAGASEAPSPYRELRLSTADPRELVRTTLESAASALDQAREGQARAADFILRGKLDDARTPLRGALETWQAVRTAIDHSAALLRLDVASLGDANTPLEPLLASLHASLGTVKDTLERQDYSALGDELAFELDRLTHEWQAALRELAGWVGQGAPTRAGGVA